MTRLWLRLVAFIAVVSLLAGCTSGPTAPEERISPSPQATGENPPTAMVGLEDCLASTILTEIPEAWTDPMMPPGADAHEIVPFFNIASVQLWDCGRAVVGTHVREEVRIVEAFVGGSIELDNGTVLGLLVLAFYTNDGVVWQTLSDLGVQVDQAEIAMTYGQPQAGSAAVGSWEIVGSDFSVSFEFPSLQATSIRSRGEATYWHMGPPHVRSDVNGTVWVGDFYDEDVIAMQFTGESRMRQMFGSQDAWSGAHQQFYDATRAYAFTGGHV